MPWPLKFSYKCLSDVDKPRAKKPNKNNAFKIGLHVIIPNPNFMAQFVLSLLEAVLTSKWPEKKILFKMGGNRKKKNKEKNMTLTFIYQCLEVDIMQGPSVEGILSPCVR